MAETVLITGASQGIGRAIAHQFAKHGYNLVLAARHEERLTEAAEELRSRYSVATLPVPTDVRDADQVSTLIQAAVTRFNAVDVLVNNAGIYLSGPVEAFTLDDWHQAIDTNLWGYIHTIHALLPHLLERGKGTIVNLCSIGGSIPAAYLAPYTTTKFAVDGLTQSLHTELGPKGIHVCGIYPNVIRSNFLERAIFRGVDEAEQQERRQQVEKVIENPLVEKPEDVASAVWDAVQSRKEKVYVGSAQASVALHTALPQLTRWMTRKVFQHKDT